MSIAVNKRSMAVIFLLSTITLSARATTGSIDVNLYPAEAVAAGAKWTINGGATWHNSGDIVEDLYIAPSTGTTYTVEFSDVPNWTTPGDKNVRLRIAYPVFTLSITYEQRICRYAPPFPEPGQLDFCALVGNATADPVYANMQAILALLKSSLNCTEAPAFCAFLDQLKCASLDINGPSGSGAPAGNGMLDAQAELGLIASVYNTPGFSLPNGLTQAGVASALAANFAYIYPILLDDLNAAGYCESLGTKNEANNFGIHLAVLFSGYATMGDANSINAIVQMAGLFGFPFAPSGLVTLQDGALLGPAGDADGDGCSNRDEYNAYAGGGSTPAIYVANALNPAIHPAGCGTTEGAIEGEGGEEGEGEGGAEGAVEGAVEGEGTIEGSEGSVEGEGAVEGEGETPLIHHSADQNGDGRISLSELLRVIQFFNSDGLHCQPGTEDGYAPDPGDQSCAHHATDYNPPDWRIRLTELLRLIQFFNSDGFHYCPGEGTEDGFCVGPA